MSTHRTNFYGIEEVPPVTRRRVEHRRRPGYELPRRPGRWTKASEYHRLLEQERREPWVAFLGVLTAFVFALLVYVVG